MTFNDLHLQILLCQPKTAHDSEAFQAYLYIFFCEGIPVVQDARDSGTRVVFLLTLRRRPLESASQYLQNVQVHGMPAGWSQAGWGP